VLGLRKEFEFENGVAAGNDYITIALFKGKASPKRTDPRHHLPDMSIAVKGARSFEEDRRY
jgi:hypothetical protein